MLGAADASVARTAAIAASLTQLQADVDSLAALHASVAAARSELSSLLPRA
jgi:hypothetical protein